MDWMTWWHRLTGWYSDIGAWLDHPVFPDDIRGGLIYPLLAVFIVWLVSKLARGFSRFPPLLGTLVGRRRTGPLDDALAAYRARLAAGTFELRHAWMKVGQTLS